MIQACNKLFENIHASLRVCAEWQLSYTKKYFYNVLNLNSREMRIFLMAINLFLNTL